MALPMFSDLNVLATHKAESLLSLIKLSADLGFERIAVNNVVSKLQSSKGKKQSSKTAVEITPPSDVILDTYSLDVIKKKYPKLRQLSRFTAVLDDAANTHRLGSPEVQKYDIIAVQPTNEKTFQLACSTLEVDIICLNFSESLGFSPKRPLIKLAIKRGIHFEIVYSPALKDNSVKRSIISNAMTFVSVARGRGIIISSGTDNTIDLRSPWDVINLGRLFGLSASQAKDAISRNCRAVLLHAEARKSCKSVVSVSLTSELKPAEAWILETSRTDFKHQQSNAISITSDDPSDSDSDDEETGDESKEESDLESKGLSVPSERKKIKLDVS